MKKIINTKYGLKYAGSALILAVVLSTLLAIVGVLFLMAARVNQMGTAAISENKELEFAVDTVIADISQKLVLDVPGIVEPNEEYYDYPDFRNRWLASLEPYESSGKYYWRQISDISGQLAGKNNNIKIEVLSQYGPIPDVNLPLADADGDGVADSIWIKLEGISSSHSKPVYAAVRIIDNSAMLNVNTGLKSDPCAPGMKINIDGKNQTQINLMPLASLFVDSSISMFENDLLLDRANNGNNINPYDLQAYLQYYIYNYEEIKAPYTPFDMSDELEMRYRYLLNNTDIDTRLESWGNQLRDDTLSTPVESNGELKYWFPKAYNTFGITGTDPNLYSIRHIATTRNMDRILNPAGLALNNGKMVNINTALPQLIFNTIKMSLQGREPNAVRLEKLAAQLAVNIVDLRDNNSDVTALTVGKNTYFGFEAQPFISDIGFKLSDSEPDDSTKNSFAVELYNPFKIDIPLSSFKIELYDANDKVADSVNMPNFIIKAQSRFVITNTSNATTEFGLGTLKSSGTLREDPNLVLAKYVLAGGTPPTYILSKRYNLRLVRKLTATNLSLDKQTTQDSWFKWDDVNDSSKFYCRSELNWNILYQEFKLSSTNTLGKPNVTTALRKNYNLVNYNDSFATIGDISRVLTIGPSTDANDMIGMNLASEPNEDEIRLDLKQPVYANMFQYLTVVDPMEYGLDPNQFMYETRIKGRININTAPWSVLAQLPSMRPDTARSIVSFRDVINPSDPSNKPFGAFNSVVDLMQVPGMDYYTIGDNNNVDLQSWPDLTPKDGAISDYEERDIIFSRISNLVTVRSDIFTAYILVRIGLDGPQKRVIAVLDRSNVVTPIGKVRILAFQSVPDPR